MSCLLEDADKSELIHGSTPNSAFFILSQATWVAPVSNNSYSTISTGHLASWTKIEYRKNYVSPSSKDSRKQVSQNVDFSERDLRKATLSQKLYSQIFIHMSLKKKSSTGARRGPGMMETDYSDGSQTRNTVGYRQPFRDRENQTSLLYGSETVYLCLSACLPTQSII